MRVFRWFAVLVVLCSVAMAMQAPARPITKRGLLDALKIGGLTSGELVRKIGERGVSFPLTPDVEEELRKAGASQQLIDAVRNNYRGPKSAAPPPPVPPIPVEKTEPPPPAPAPRPTVEVRRPVALTRPGVYVRTADQWAEVPSESMTFKKGRFMGAIKRGEITGSIPGVQSPNAYRSPVRFLIVTPTGSAISDFALVVLHGKKDEREFKIDASRKSGKDLLPFSRSKTADNNYQVDFTQGAGEYGFLAPGNDTEGATSQYGKVYTFRVLQ